MRVISCVPVDGGKYILTVEDDSGNKLDLPVIRTQELVVERSRLYAKKDQCEHTDTKIRYRLMADGRKCAKRQCLACGDSVSSMIKKAEWPEDCEPWDERAAMQYKSQEWELLLKHYYLQRDSSSVKEARYGDYLRSEEWRQKRHLVLERDKNLCQGCRVRRATQVHHLTYEHIFDELLFELVSVCGECHKKIHPDKCHGDSYEL